MKTRLLAIALFLFASLAIGAQRTPEAEAFGQCANCSSTTGCCIGLLQYGYTLCTSYRYAGTRQCLDCRVFGSCVTPPPPPPEIP